MGKLIGVGRPLHGSAVLSPHRSRALARLLVRKLFLSPSLGLRARLQVQQFVLRIALGLDREQTAPNHWTRRIPSIDFRRLTETISQVNCTPGTCVDLANVVGLLDQHLPCIPSQSMLGGVLGRELLVNDLRCFRIWDAPP